MHIALVAIYVTGFAKTDRIVTTAEIHASLMFNIVATYILPLSRSA